MVVDDIEDDVETPLVTRVDKPLQPGRSAI
jgi:hypothetical protein